MKAPAATTTAWADADAWGDKDPPSAADAAAAGGDWAADGPAVTGWAAALVSIAPVGVAALDADMAAATAGATGGHLRKVWAAIQTDWWGEVLYPPAPGAAPAPVVASPPVRPHPTDADGRGGGVDAAVAAAVAAAATRRRGSVAAILTASAGPEVPIGRGGRDGGSHIGAFSLASWHDGLVAAAAAAAARPGVSRVTAAAGAVDPSTAAVVIEGDSPVDITAALRSMGLPRASAGGMGRGYQAPGGVDGWDLAILRRVPAARPPPAPSTSAAAEGGVSSAAATAPWRPPLRLVTGATAFSTLPVRLLEALSKSTPTSRPPFPTGPLSTGPVVEVVDAAGVPIAGTGPTSSPAPIPPPSLTVGVITGWNAARADPLVWELEAPRRQRGLRWSPVGQVVGGAQGGMGAVVSYGGGVVADVAKAAAALANTTATTEVEEQLAGGLVGPSVFEHDDPLVALVAAVEAATAAGRRVASVALSGRPLPLISVATALGSGAAVAERVLLSVPLARDTLHRSVAAAYLAGRADEADRADRWAEWDLDPDEEEEEAGGGGGLESLERGDAVSFLVRPPGDSDDEGDDDDNERDSGGRSDGTRARAVAADDDDDDDHGGIIGLDRELTAREVAELAKPYPPPYTGPEPGVFLGDAVHTVTGASPPPGAWPDAVDASADGADGTRLILGDGGLAPVGDHTTLFTRTGMTVTPHPPPSWSSDSTTPSLLSPPPLRWTVAVELTYTDPPPRKHSVAGSARTTLLDRRVLSAKRLRPDRLTTGGLATLASAVDTALAVCAPSSATAFAAEAIARIAPLLLHGHHRRRGAQVLNEPETAGVEPPSATMLAAMTQADALSALGREEVGLGAAAAAAVVLADAATAAADAAASAIGTSRRVGNGPAPAGSVAALTARLGPAVLGIAAAAVEPDDVDALAVLGKVADALLAADGTSPPSSASSSPLSSSVSSAPSSPSSTSSSPSESASAGDGASTEASSPPSAAAVRARVTDAVTAWRLALDAAGVPAVADADIPAAAVAAATETAAGAWGGLLAAPPVGGEGVAARAVAAALSDRY
ncbi:hypothetical protein MMPV_008007 [Pyropia vietnamensis]